jgi:homoaconitate hydratase
LLEPGEVGISATNRNFKGRMGSRDAKCYLASPEVVAASAVAGYIRGPHEFGVGAPQRNYTELATTSGGAEKVEILAGFPQRLRGRLVFMPQDNVNTDAIYGKDYTYRDDMTPEMMAKVVMENYDPQFAARTQAGDVIVSQFNFGTGSSREQAVTCLKAKRIPLVIAASFSQTYLRNAFNNGFLCIEVPEFVARLRDQLAKQIAAKEKTIIPGDDIDIDFTASTITWRGEKFTFPALGSVPQSLVIAGGVENLVAKRLAV